MAQTRRGHTYQTSVADAANLFGAGAGGGGGGGDDSDPFASISTSATSGVESTALPAMSEEQGEYDHAAEARGGEAAGSEAADLFGGGGQEQQDDFANTTGLPTSSSGLFGDSGDASGANDDWLGGETAAVDDGQQQQHGYDAAADSTGWYDGGYASQQQQSGYGDAAQQQGYDAYSSQQAADGSYYQGEYDATAYQQHQPQPYEGYQQQWDEQNAHTGYDHQQQQYAADYYSGANYDASSQQQYAPQSAAWDHSQGYDASQQQQASTTAGQYDYSQAAPSQGQYDYAPTNQQQPQQDYYASTSYDAYQYSAADYSQYGQPQQAGEATPSNYDPYAPPSQQQQQHAAPADQWSSGYSQQQQQQQPAQHDPYAPSSSSQSAYEPQASTSPYDPSSTPRANSGIDLPSDEHSYSQPQYSASALSYENSYDAQYHDETATKDAFGSPVPAATGCEQQQQRPGMYDPAPAPPAASSAYDAPSSAYDAPPPAASVTSPTPPPKGPPKGPPRGPPRGPARGPSRASASARVEAQPEPSAAPAVAPASDDFVPQSPALQLNGMTAFDQEPEVAPTTTAAPQQSLDDEPAPWDLPTDSEEIGASSAGADDAEQSSKSVVDVETDAEADADPEASLAPPRRERQATPKLVVTGDDDSTKEIETTPSEPDDYLRGDDGEGNDTIIERRDSASSAHDSKSNDDDLDEATREFNDLHLIRSRSKSQSQSPVSSRRGASRASTRSAKKTSAGEWTENAKPSASGYQEQAAGEDAGYGYGYGAGGESAAGEAGAEAHDPYAPPAVAAGLSDAYGQDQDAGYGYDAGYGAEEATGGAEDPYGPSSQASQYDADPYAPHSGQADPYAPPAGQKDPYAPSTQSYAPSEESKDPYAPSSQQPAQDDADPYGPADPSQSGQYGAPSSSQYDPYAPSSGNADPYAPAAASSSGQDGYGGSAYNPYDPSEQPQPAPAHDPYAPAAQLQRSASTGGEAAPYGAEHGADPYASQQGGDPYAPGYGAAVGAAAGATAAAASSAYGSDGGWGSSVGGVDGPYGSSQGRQTEPLDTPLASRPPGPPSSTGYSAYDPPPQSSQHARTDSQSRSAYGDEGAAAGPYGPSRMASGYFGSRTPSASYDAPSHASQDGFSQQGAPSPYELPRERMGGFDAGFADAPDPAEEKRNARIPLACFGIDGKIVTFFPTQSASSAAASAGAGAGAGGGYGYASDTAPPTKVTVRQLSHLVPPTSFASSFDPLLFPGPAFENTAVTSAIARATGAGSSISTSVKTKKATLIKFLRDAAVELEAGMGYRRRRTSFVDGSSKPAMDPSTPSSARFPADEEAGKAEDRILLIRLLAIVLEQDGNVVNNAAFDEAVRALLLGEEGAQQGSTFAPGFAEPLSNSGKGGDSSPLAPSPASPKHHVQIRELLLSGQRREAVAYATSQKLWSHAMVIASAVDQETWRRVANDFIEAEFGSDGGSDGGSDAVSDDASLKLAYGLFSGQEPSTIYGLFRSGATTTAAGWRKSAAVVLANRCAGDSAALTAMGDGLLLCGRQEAAHICYLLSPRTSPVSGVDPRMALLGAPSPMASTSYLRDLDAFILSEIYEFSHALIPPAKGQEAFPGLAHLQAYRLLHAWQLAELGEAKRAQKYCEAVAGVIKATKGSPFLHRTLVAQVKELSDRLVGSPHQLDSGGNWVTRKMQRPTLDGMLSAFEGRFAKFIAGDDDSAPGSGSATPNGGGGASGAGGADKSRPSGLPQSSSAVGAFSHYSAITPDAMSGGISRVQSFADFGGATGGGISRPSSRAQSAAGFRQQGARTPSFMQQQQERAVSAMAGGAGAGPYGAPPASSSSVGGSPYLGWSRSDSPALGQGQGQQSEFGAAAPWPGHGGPGEEQRSDAGGEGGGNDDGYRGPTYGYDAESSNVPSGVKPRFISNLDADFGQTGGEDGGGADFVSPMDAFTPAGAASFPSYAPQQQSGSSWRNDEPAEDDDDLGFGNSAHKRNNESRGEDEQRDGSKQREESSSADSAPEAKSKGSPAVDDAKKAPELKPSPSTSWLGRLWGRKEPSADAAATKAAQAHMGEESAFYYDKDLKRWVNKKAGDSGGAAATPPPPPRATTASPSMASRGGPGGGAGGGSGGPPGAPQRSFSAAVSRTTSQEGLSNEYRSGALGGGPGGPPRAASSAFNPSTRGTPPIAESGGFGSDRNTPSPPSSDGALPPSTMSSPGGGPRSMMGRTRSNLGDLNQPAAMQPPNAGAMSSSMPPPHAPPAARGAGAKKKPISKRYVRVD